MKANQSTNEALDKMAENARELGLDYEPAQTATYTCGVCGVSMQMEQPAQRKPLTDEQWQEIADTLGCFITRSQKEIIEAAFGIKENT